MRERAILMTVDFDSIKREFNIKDVSEELAELSSSAGVFVVQNLQIRQKTPNAALLIGKGKAEEMRELAKKENADVIIFEANLSSTQQRNLEELIQIKTIDRTQLILDIFAQRARSKEGKLQVELAQMKYLLPRLTGKGITLSRLGGGVGTRGPGEQKLEVDRRRIRERISKFSRELELIEKRRLEHIHKKKKRELPLIALVGYTNAGKSTLFNALTRSSVVVQDKLFSTLDTTTRIVNFPGNRKALISDTVGFVRDLPHHLIESFKATLEETVHADILLHVIDASREDMPEMAKAVRLVLKDLGAEQKNTILVLNKDDLLDKGGKENIRKDPRWSEGVFISSLTGSGLDELRTKIDQTFSGGILEEQLWVPNHELKWLSFIYKETEVLNRVDSVEGARLDLRLSRTKYEYLKQKLELNAG